MTRRWVRNAAAIALVSATAVVGQVVSTGSRTPVSAQTTGSLASGGEYHPVTPVRIFDTRTGLNDTAPIGRKPTSPQGRKFTVDVLGQGGVPAEVAGQNRDVLAVVLNVTVINPPAAGYLSISPAGYTAPNGARSSLVNFSAGGVVPNLAIVGIGTGGAISADLVTPSTTGFADVAIDVYGWISKSAYPDAADTGGRLKAVGPGRILDTRTGPSPQAIGKPVAQDGRLKLQIRGANSVSPAVSPIVPNRATITGVMVNITAVNTLPTSRATFVSATPDRVPAGAAPTTSNTNVVPGQVKASMAIVPIGADGAIRLYNRSGDVHLVVDVLGYIERGFDATTSTGRIIPLDAPFRVFDTREPAFGNTPLGYASQESWSFNDFVNSITMPSTSGPTPLGGQSALIGNLTGTGLTRWAPTVPVSTYITMFPGGKKLPLSSNLNLREGQSVPNMSLLKYGTAGTDPYVVQAYNAFGSVHYLLDVYAVVLS